MAPARVTSLARLAAAGVFGGLARLRGDRPLHPAGVAFEGALVVETAALDGVALFASPGRRRAIVRFSRGFGLPEPLPEIVSFAVKVPDAYGPGRDQDLLLTATGERPVLRHVFAASRSHLTRAYSTVLPFAVGGRRRLLGAVPRPARRAPEAGDLGELEELATSGDLVFDLRVCDVAGPWRTVARLEVGRRLGDAEAAALRFNSDASGGGIAPVGFVNAVRGAAYAAAARNRP